MDYNRLPRKEGEEIDLLRRDEEGLKSYRVGGYHPVSIGDCLNNRYTVISKLGWGHFSTVWLCSDNQGGPSVAVKIQKSDVEYSEAAKDEIEMLKLASSVSAANVVTLFDSFVICGPNGNHHAMVFEVLGDNLLALSNAYHRLPRDICIPLRYGKGIPIPIVRRIAREILLGTKSLHSQCKIIHTDIKLENVALVSPLGKLLVPTTQKGQPKCGTIEAFGFSSLAWSQLNSLVKLVDLGNACYENHHFTEYITTRQYRAPEIIVEYPYDSKVDVWSIACIVFELVTGSFLFNPKKGDTHGNRDQYHLELIVRLLGKPTDTMARNGKTSKDFFRRDGTFHHSHTLPKQRSLYAVLHEDFCMEHNQATSLVSFLLPMLDLNPTTRQSAEGALKHEWLSY